MAVTEEQLRAADAAYQRDWAAAELSREHREALIVAALADPGWSQSAIARALGVSRSAINAKAKSLGRAA